MAKAKARGSVAGIKQHQQAKREASRSALLTALNTLLCTSKQIPWSNILVSSTAGLKSTVALKKPWNADIRDAVLKHNIGLSPGKTGTDAPPKGCDLKVQDLQLTALKIEVLKLRAEKIALLSEIRLLQEKAARNDKLHRSGGVKPA